MKKNVLLLFILGLICVIGAAFLTTMSGSKSEISPTPTKSPSEFSVLSFSPSVIFVEKKQKANISLDIVINTRENKATGAQLEILYDPKVLGNTAISPGSFFENPIILIKKIDQKKGRISYALAISPTGTPKKGQGTVAIMRFSVKANPEKKTIIQLLPKSLVTAQNATESVLETTSNAQISFE